MNIPRIHFEFTRLSPKVIAALGLVYVLWSSSFLGIRYALQGFPPFILAGFRSTMAGLLLYTFSRQRGAPRPSRSLWLNAAWVGLLVVTAGSAGVVIAQQKVDSGIAGTLTAATPLFIVLLDWLRPGGVKPPRQVLLGVIIGICGIILLVGPTNLTDGHLRLPAVALLIPAGSLGFAVGSLSSRGAGLQKFPFLSTAIEMLAGGLGLLVMATLFGQWSHFDPARISPLSALSLVYLIICCEMVGYTSFIYLMSHTTPAIASTYAFVNPIGALLLGWAIAGEVLSLQTITAAVVLISGVAIITTGYLHKHKGAIKSTTQKAPSELEVGG